MLCGWAEFLSTIRRRDGLVGPLDLDALTASSAWTRSGYAVFPFQQNATQLDSRWPSCRWSRPRKRCNWWSAVSRLAALVSSDANEVRTDCVRAASELPGRFKKDESTCVGGRCYPSLSRTGGLRPGIEKQRVGGWRWWSRL